MSCISDMSEPVLMTADEVAELLGVNCKTIPHRRLGRRLLFERGCTVNHHLELRRLRWRELIDLERGRLRRN